MWQRYSMCCCTHSTVNSWAPTGMQYTNCMALQRRWNSTHSSTCITPLLGSGPRQIGSSKKPRTRVRMTSNMDSPQHSLSLVRRSPSRAMAICCESRFPDDYSVNLKHPLCFLNADKWTGRTCGVPRRSISGTMCSAVYLASRRFILASRRSPSVRKSGYSGSLI